MLLTTLSPGIKFFSHVAYHVASSKAMNYACIVYVATILCLELFYEMATLIR
jgi:hypothetical protein